MRLWTRREDAIVRSLGQLGAKACADAIREATGVRRTPKAVQNRASRIGASLFEHEACPRCGRLVKSLRPSGLCDVCHERSIEEPRAVESMLARSIDPPTADEVRAAKRARAAARKARSREGNVDSGRNPGKTR